MRGQSVNNHVSARHEPRRNPAHADHDRRAPTAFGRVCTAHTEAIKQSLTEQPVRTTAEAIDRIESLTGLRRGLTQTRTFLAGLGFTWQRTRAVPVPPKSR